MTVGGNITTTATSLDQNDLLRSSLQLKQFMKLSKRTNEDSFLLEKTISSLLEEVPSTMENKFDTPGPGSYEVRGQFSRSVLTGRRVIPIPGS